VTSSDTGTAPDVDARLDEIDRLSREARATRDPAVERRLVELRHEAFGGLSRLPGRDRWPATFEDPFPEERGVPVVEPADLTADVLGGALTNHGCLHVRGLVDAATVDWLVTHIERAFEARQRVADGEPVEAAAPWYVPFPLGRAKAEGFASERFVRAVDSPRALNELACLFEDVGITAAVAGYLGERPAMIANKWILRRTPSGLDRTNYHQDGAFLGDGIRTVDCWIALSPCGPGTGRPGMDLVPRRFAGVLPKDDAADFPWSQTPASVEAAAPGVPVASPVFAPGDALFFDELLPHRTAYGPELGPRYAVESWFVAPSSYPEKHVPVVL
jgi:hypothetical protein